MHSACGCGATASHLHEVVPPGGGVHQKLHGTRVDVLGGARQADGVAQHGAPQLGGQVHGGRHLHHLRQVKGEAGGRGYDQRAGCRIIHPPAGVLSPALRAHLLVPPLHAAVALVQVHGAAVLVGEHLQLHVAGGGQVALHQHAGVAEAAGGLALARLRGGLQLICPAHDAHALPAAAHDGLEHDRVADAARLLLRYGRMDGQ